MKIWRMHTDVIHHGKINFDIFSNGVEPSSLDNNQIGFISYLSDEKQNQLFGKPVSFVSYSEQ